MMEPPQVPCMKDQAAVLVPLGLAFSENLAYAQSEKQNKIIIS